jgi:hypothetical protein
MAGSIKYSYAVAQERTITNYLAEGNRAAAENVYKKNLEGKMGRHGGQGVAASQARMQSLLYGNTSGNDVGRPSTPRTTFNYVPAPPVPAFDWSPPPATPYVPPASYTPTTAVKIEDSNIISWRSPQVSAEFLEEMYFQDIGGTEILRVARHDTVNGEEIAWQPITNIDNIQNSFNPQNILSSTSQSGMFDFYSIDLDSNIANLDEAIYIEDETLVIQLDNLDPDEFVQVQVTKEGAEFYGTLTSTYELERRKRDNDNE